MEVGTLSDPVAGDTQRRAGGISLGYKQGEFKFGNSVEYRDEDNSLTGHRTTWLVRNSFGWQATKAWRLLGKVNWSDSSNSQGAFYDGAFHEYVAAAAYRPVTNDRWNTLIKYTNFYNVPTPGQVTPANTTLDYAQKSQIFAIDTIYDLKPWLSVGGKYAIRIGELENAKVGGTWFDGRADLAILRFDWHWVKEWDALMEVRRMRTLTAFDARSGALVGIYRHIGESVKLGAGFNFTNYSDDLTDLSFRSRGWFVNVVGTM